LKGRGIYVLAVRVNLVRQPNRLLSHLPLFGFGQPREVIFIVMNKQDVFHVSPPLDSQIQVLDLDRGGQKEFMPAAGKLTSR
jgi:hypothetical protein